MFSSAAALCIYNCLVGFNQEVDYCYWSALLVSLSLSLPVTHIVHALTHTHTHSHTHTHTDTHDIESSSSVLLCQTRSVCS